MNHKKIGKESQEIYDLICLHGSLHKWKIVELYPQHFNHTNGKPKRIAETSIAGRLSDLYRIHKKIVPSISASGKEVKKDGCTVWEPVNLTNKHRVFQDEPKSIVFKDVLGLEFKGLVDEVPKEELKEVCLDLYRELYILKISSSYTESDVAEIIKKLKSKRVS